jgi:hypothetical protein
VSIVRVVGFSAAALLGAGALALLFAGALAPSLFVLVEAVIVGLGVVFERTTYKPLETRPGKDWSPTPERFVDPASGRMVRVYTRDGERKYVAEGPVSPGQDAGGAGS